MTKKVEINATKALKIHKLALKDQLLFNKALIIGVNVITDEIKFKVQQKKHVWDNMEILKNLNFI